QLYLVGGRDCALSAIERAKAAGFSALVVTIDTAVAGMRERDLRNGVKELLGGNLGSKLPFVSQLLIKPRWLAGFLADGGLMKFQNVVVPGKGPMMYTDVAAALEGAVPGRPRGAGWARLRLWPGRGWWRRCCASN